MRVVVVVLLAASFLGLVGVKAFAQVPSFSIPDTTRQYTDEEKERMKANEEAAKAARAKLPDQKVSSDPWAAARSAETPAPKKPKAPAKQ